MLEQRRDRRNGAKRDIDIATQQRGIDIAGAAVGDHQHVEAGGLLEHFGGQMRRSADAARRIGDLAGLPLGQRDQIGDRGDRDFWPGDDQHRAAGDQRYRREILQRIVGRLAADERRDDEGAAGREQDGVAVGLRLGDEVGADASIAAGPVVDDDRLPQALMHAGRELARDDIGAAARRERQHDMNRPRRETFDRLGCAGAGRDQHAAQQAESEPAGGLDQREVSL